MANIAEVSEEESDGVIIMDSPPAQRSRRPWSDGEDDPIDGFSPPPPQSKPKPTAKAKAPTSVPRSVGSSSSSKSKATPKAAPAPVPRRLPPPQAARPQRKSAAPARYASAGQHSSEGEEEFSPPKASSSRTTAGARSSSAVPKLARSSSQASSSKKPSSTTSSTAARAGKGKGKAPAAKLKAPPKPPAPKPVPVPRAKARPGWKGYAEPEAGKELKPPTPSKGYLSGLDELWSQGMLNPFQDGEPLKKSLRSGRQVRNPSARWGDDEREEDDEDYEDQDEAEAERDAPETGAHEMAGERLDHRSVTGSAAPSEGGPDYLDADEELVEELSQQARAEHTAASASRADLSQDVGDEDDYSGGMSYEPAPEARDPSPPPAPAPVSPVKFAPAPAPLPVAPVQNFRRISTASSTQITVASLPTALKPESIAGRLVAQLPRDGSPFQVPARPLSPPLPYERKRGAADGVEAMPLKKLRSTLPPPPGASPRPSRTASLVPDEEAAVAGEDVQMAEDEADDVGDLSFYPQIQVDFDAEPTPDDELTSHRALAEENFAHLTKTKALVLAQLSGHAPPLPPAKSAPDAAADDNAESLRTLTELLRGTAEKGEGNSCLIQGVQGSGKTTVLNRALSQLESSSSSLSSAEGYESPHVIRLSALVQKDDKAAIREIGRQFGIQDQDDAADEANGAEGDGQASLAPTTLPAHLLAILTAPSKKAIIIVLQEFDVFASFGRGGRQMLLYCLLDVVQSIRPSMDGQSGRGVAVVGVTSRLDTLHLLEKRVKSRFSHRIIRITSPFHGDRSQAIEPSTARNGPARPTTADGAEGAPPSGLEQDGHDVDPKWLPLLSRALVPWQLWEEAGADGEGDWRGAWRESIEHLLANATIQTGLERLTWLTTDVRALLKVFVLPVIRLTLDQPFLTPANIQRSLTEQAQGAGWGKDMRKFKTLSLPCLSVLAAVKDLGERGIQEFNFEHVFFTYGEFAKARLVGTGKTRFGRLVMKDAFNQLAQTAVIFPTQSPTSASGQSFSTSAADFAKHRCAVSPYDIVELFRGPAGKGILSQLSSWGRKFDI